MERQTDGKMNEWIDVQTDEKTDRWTVWRLQIYRQMDRKMYMRADELMYKYTDRKMDRQREGWTEGQTNGWNGGHIATRDGSKEGWTDRQTDRRKKWLQRTLNSLLIVYLETVEQMDRQREGRKDGQTNGRQTKTIFERNKEGRRRFQKNLKCVINLLKCKL